MFVGSFKIQRMLCKREVVPRDSLKAALSGQATPCRGESAYGLFQGLLKYCVCMSPPFSSYTADQCLRPRYSEVTWCVLSVKCPRQWWLWKLRPPVRWPCASLALEGTLKVQMTPQPELIPHASEWNTTRLSSLALCPPGWKALSDEGCRFWPSRTSAAPVFCSPWAGGLGRLLQPTSVLERR